MHRVISDTPANGIQLYIDGRRYRSLFAASTDSEITFCYLCRKVKEHDGAPFKIGNHTVVTEKWILAHPQYLMDLLNGDVEL